MDTIKVRDLRLGDVVQTSNDAFGTSTVKQVKEGVVYFFRPYVHTGDFSYTGGVICYIGFEEFSRSQDSDDEYPLHSRVTLK